MSRIPTSLATATPSEIAGGLASRDVEFRGSDTASHDELTLAIEIEGRIKLTYPRTLTQAEITEAARHLVPQVARIQCMLLVNNLPGEIMSTVFSQVREIAEHEIRMWRVRSEFPAPDIQEQRARLPIAR